MKWLALRILVTAVAAWELVSVSATRSNINWIACALISFATGLGAFIWFSYANSSNKVDWSRPFSLTEPFLPMMTYPLRYWILAAFVLIVGGSLSLLHSIVSGTPTALGGTFLGMGLSIYLGISLVRILVKR